MSQIYIKGKPTPPNPQPIKLTCRRCNYSWLYKGYKRYYTSCPNCLAKVKIRRSEEGGG